MLYLLVQLIKYLLCTCIDFHNNYLKGWCYICCTKYNEGTERWSHLANVIYLNLESNSGDYLCRPIVYCLSIFLWMVELWVVFISLLISQAFSKIFYIHFMIKYLNNMILKKVELRVPHFKDMDGKGNHSNLMSE